ncbi:MAG: hypothetical protein GX614_01720 [Sandaracinaceae bacterium]|nr:hypothetical protein [Sandaracinaceae bacterium]
MKAQRISFFMLLGFLMAGCGPSSGVPGNRKLSELDDGDASRICRFTGEMLEDIFTSRNFDRAACSVTGYLAELLPLTTFRCEEERDRCLEQRLEDRRNAERNAFDACDELDDDAYLPGCEATVAEYEDCLRAIEDRVREVSKELTCDNLLSGSVDSRAIENVFDVPECRRLGESCTAGLSSGG